MKEIPLDQIRLDGGSQPRVEIDLEAVSEYKEAIEKGVNLPRLDVFYDGADNWLADGFHRWHGGKAAGVEFLECNVHVGTQREAVLFSVGANATHGLKRSAADKRKAVTTLLNDPEWCKWSSRRIAEQCNVSQGLVEDVRSKLEEEESSLRKCAVTNEETGDSGESGEKTRTYINRHGTESQMKTGGINAKRSKSKEGKAEAGNPVSETAAGVASDPEADRRAAIMGAQRITEREPGDESEVEDESPPPRNSQNDSKASDDSADRFKIQRSRTIKTAEALLRAFDDLQELKRNRYHSKSIDMVKQLIATAKEW